MAFLEWRRLNSIVEDKYLVGKLPTEGGKDPRWLVCRPAYSGHGLSLLPLGGNAPHIEDQIGAIGGQRVVETRLSRKLVYLVYVLAQQPLSILRRHPQSIDTDVLAPDIASHSGSRWGDLVLSEFTPADELQIQGLQNRYRRRGIGAPLAADATASGKEKGLEVESDVDGAEREFEPARPAPQIRTSNGPPIWLIASSKPTKPSIVLRR